MIRMGQVDFLAFEENGEMSWAGPCKGGGPQKQDERRFYFVFFLIPAKNVGKARHVHAREFSSNSER